MDVKKGGLKLTETLNKQFVSSFPDKPEGNPKQAWDTCDIHLESKQPLSFVDPKGNPAEEGTWDVVKDVEEIWRQRRHVLWGIIGFVSFIFMIIVYYYWGHING